MYVNRGCRHAFSPLITRTGKSVVSRFIHCHLIVVAALGTAIAKKDFFFCFNNENHIENEQTKPYLSTWYQLTPSRQIWTVGGWHWNSFGNGGSISILGWHTLGGLWNSLGMTGAIPQTLFLRLSSHLKGLFRVTWVKTTFYCCNTYF